MNEISFKETFELIAFFSDVFNLFDFKKLSLCSFLKEIRKFSQIAEQKKISLNAKNEIVEGWFRRLSRLQTRAIRSNRSDRIFGLISHISKPKRQKSDKNLCFCCESQRREKRKKKAKMLFEHELVSFANTEWKNIEWRSRCCRFLFGNSRFHLIELQAFNLISCRLLKCFRDY